MKKFAFFLIVSIVISFIGLAQDDQPLTRGAKLQTLKIAYITRQLNLTSEEAQKFWPVYYTYTAELKKTRQEKKEDELVFEENVLNIRKKYKGDFKKILNTDERVNKVLTADRDFNNVIRKELQKRMQLRNKGNLPTGNNQ